MRKWRPSGIRSNWRRYSLYALVALGTLALASSLHFKYFECLEALCTGAIIRSAWTGA